MSFDSGALAKRRHGSTGHDEADWQKALENARVSLKVIDVDSQTLTHIALGCREPAKLTLMTRLIYQYAKAHPSGEPISDLLFKSVNTSPFGLSDWIDAIDYFHRWLTDRNRKIDLLPMIKYLDCCGESGDAKKTGQTLAALVEHMLDTFGYEAG